MANALYYTFSTIAQTLAGAMALLAAFLLYRVQTLQTAIDRDADRISGALLNLHGRPREMLDAGQYEELLQAAAQAAYPHGHYRAETERARLPKTLFTKSRLVRNFRGALYLTAALITFSVLALIATPYAVEHTRIAIGIFLLGVLGFAACMVSYIVVLKDSFS